MSFLELGPHCELSIIVKYHQCCEEDCRVDREDQGNAVLALVQEWSEKQIRSIHFSVHCGGGNLLIQDHRHCGLSGMF